MINFLKHKDFSFLKKTTKKTTTIRSAGINKKLLCKARMKCSVIDDSIYIKITLYHCLGGYFKRQFEGTLPIEEESKNSYRHYVLEFIKDQINTHIPKTHRQYVECRVLEKLKSEEIRINGI